MLKSAQFIPTIFNLSGSQSCLAPFNKKLAKFWVILNHCMMTMAWTTMNNQNSIINYKLINQPARKTAEVQAKIKASVSVILPQLKNSLINRAVSNKLSWVVGAKEIQLWKMPFIQLNLHKRSHLNSKFLLIYN